MSVSWSTDEDRWVGLDANWIAAGSVRSGSGCFATPHRAPRDELLLPTPVAQASHNSPQAHLRKKPGRVRVTDLQIIADYGLFTTGGRIDL